MYQHGGATDEEVVFFSFNFFFSILTVKPGTAQYS